MDATIVISTKDREEDLAKAVVSALAQKGADIEVLVVDDGSSDGTSRMVRERFPQAVLITHAESAGYIVGRNKAARAARGKIIVSIDDDAEFFNAVLWCNKYCRSSRNLPLASWRSRIGM